MCIRDRFGAGGKGVSVITEEPGEPQEMMRCPPGINRKEEMHSNSCTNWISPIVCLYKEQSTVDYITSLTCGMKSEQRGYLKVGT